jgi:hypothetical protein
MGKIAIAFAQLEWAVFVIAKRVDGTMKMAEFAMEHRGKKHRGFQQWCDFVIKKSPDNPNLVTQIKEAQELAEERNNLFHGIWFKEGASDQLRLFRIPRTGQPHPIPLDPTYFAALVKRIRSVRDSLLVQRGPADFEWKGDSV